MHLCILKNQQVFEIFLNDFLQLIALISLVLCATLVYSTPLGGYYSTFTGDFGESLWCVHWQCSKLWMLISHRAACHGRKYIKHFWNETQLCAERKNAFHLSSPGGPSAFDGASFASMQSARGDNRQNRGDQGLIKCFIFSLFHSLTAKTKLTHRKK